MFNEWMLQRFPYIWMMNAIKLFHSKNSYPTHINDKKTINPLIVTVPDIVVFISFCAFDIVCGSLYISLIIPFTIGY